MKGRQDPGEATGSPEIPSAELPTGLVEDADCVAAGRDEALISTRGG